MSPKLKEYRVKAGLKFGVANDIEEGEIVKLRPEDAKPFLDKLIDVEEAKKNPKRQPASGEAQLKKDLKAAEKKLSAAEAKNAEADEKLAEAEAKLAELEAAKDG